MPLPRGHPELVGEGSTVPRTLAGRALRDTGIGSRTGLGVVALQQSDRIVTPMTSETVLPAEAELLMLGSVEQREHFRELYRNH